MGKSPSLQESLFEYPRVNPMHRVAGSIHLIFPLI
jgi:hypothetical protein